MEKNKSNQTYKIIVAVILTAAITFSATLFGYYYYLEKKGVLINSYDENSNIAESLDVVRTKLEQYYKGDIDEDELKDGAIKGYVEGLGDKYTTYMTEDEWKNFELSITSDYKGIGVYIGQLKKTGDIVIMATVGKDSPAEKAGLKAGDIITEVEGENVKGKEVEYITSKVKGKEGTKVHLKVLRENEEGTAEELEFDVTRESIKINQVESKVLDSNIGYISFMSFTEETDEEFKEEYNKLKEQGIEKLIIDLRDNGGGYVESALGIADMMIPSGKTLLITEDKSNNRTERKSQTDVEIDMPIVVLVNENSASASEILTGILKDYKIATIVGTKTYGKGVIQSIIPEVLNGVLKVTTSEYYTPNENKINNVRNYT